MDFTERLRRITDLFVEGTGVYLGDDPQGHPILVWVNKLNSFQVEEARRDGAARRGLRLAELGKPDTPERAAMNSEVVLWTVEELRQRWVNQKSEELYLDVLNDIEADPEWRDKLGMIRRLPTLLREANAAEDDPRRQELVEMQQGYFQAIADGQEQKQKDALREAAKMSRKDLQADFLERWRQRLSLDEFMEERRVTELFYALRACEATRKDGAFDHTDCNHSQRALAEREQVRGLPEGVIVKCIEALDAVTLTEREAGNLDAPASSSASSERPNVEEDSTPSTPAEISAGAPTT